MDIVVYSCVDCTNYAHHELIHLIFKTIPNSMHASKWRTDCRPPFITLPVLQISRRRHLLFHDLCWKMQPLRCELSSQPESSKGSGHPKQIEKQKKPNLQICNSRACSKVRGVYNMQHAALQLYELHEEIHRRLNIGGNILVLNNEHFTST